ESARVEAAGTASAAVLGSGHRQGHGHVLHDDAEELALAAGAAGAGVVSAQDAAMLWSYRREIAVGRLTEYFGEGSLLAETFAFSLSDEAGARPSMAEVVEALRAQPVAELAQPAIVVERAAAASAALALAAEAAEAAAAAESLSASVEDADSGA